MLADGGDCVTDMDVFRGQERLCGALASETTTHRVLKSIDERLLGRVRAARAAARARVWDAGARPESTTLSIGATLLTAHSDRELAAGNYKHGYGFHPLCWYLDETGEAPRSSARGTPGRTPPQSAHILTAQGLHANQLRASFQAILDKLNEVGGARRRPQGPNE